MEVKKGYYVYDMGMYPRKLYVCPNGAACAKDIANAFHRVSGASLDSEKMFPRESTVAATTMHEVERNTDKAVGAMVAFYDAKQMTGRMICHEGFHVMDGVMWALGIERDEDANNEHLAYLLDWIYARMEDARKGVGEFIEFKSDE